jgi:hypothetical protein
MIERRRQPESEDNDDTAMVMEAIAFLRRVEGLTAEHVRQLDAIQAKVDRRREPGPGGDPQI